jgi:hypothetical protein
MYVQDVRMGAATAGTTGQTGNRVAHRPMQTVEWERKHGRVITENKTHQMKWKENATDILSL